MNWQFFPYTATLAFDWQLIPAFRPQSAGTQRLAAATHSERAGAQSKSREIFPGYLPLCEAADGFHDDPVVHDHDDGEDGAGVGEGDRKDEEGEGMTVASSLLPPAWPLPSSTHTHTYIHTGIHRVKWRSSDRH